MNPPKPKETDPVIEFEKYDFRKAAAVYFGMPNPAEFIPEQELFVTKPPFHPKPKTVKRKVKPVLKKPKQPPVEEEEEEDEGC